MDPIDWAIAILILALLIDQRHRHAELVHYSKAIGMMLNELTDLAARQAAEETSEEADHVCGD